MNKEASGLADFPKIP